jgi:uncharacterized membrane protein
MLRPRPRLAASLFAVLLTVPGTRSASAQTVPAPREVPGLGLAALRPLHWGLQTKAEPAVNEIPQNAYVSFYITGAVLIALGSSLALVSTVQLYGAVQRANTGDEVLYSMAVGAEGLLALVGLAFVVLGTVLHSEQSARHRAPAAGTVHAMFGPAPSGSGAFGALAVTF